MQESLLHRPHYFQRGQVLLFLEEVRFLLVREWCRLGGLCFHPHSGSYEGVALSDGQIAEEEIEASTRDVIFRTQEPTT